MSTSEEATDNPDRVGERYNFIYPWKFWAKQSFSPGNSGILCYTHWKFQGQKPRSLETPRDFFLITILFFLTNLWKFYMLIPMIPLEISGISHYCCLDCIIVIDTN